MYKIIGGDQKEYGPVTVAEILAWVREGRVTGRTSAKSEGTTEWKPLANFPEFAHLAAAASGAVPPIGLTLPGADPRAATRNELRAPAIFMLVVAILNLATDLYGLVSPARRFHLQMPFPFLDPQMIELQKMATRLSLPSQIIGMILGVICVMGAVSMLKLRRYGLCLAAAVLMLVPVGGCCCLLGIGCGIWSLVVLNNPTVRSAFE